MLLRTLAAVFALTGATFGVLLGPQNHQASQSDAERYGQPIVCCTLISKRVTTSTEFAVPEDEMILVVWRLVSIAATAFVVAATNFSFAQDA